MSVSPKKLPFNPPRPVCTWSAHAPQSGLSPSPFPRDSHSLTVTATATGELFLFGGHVHGYASNDLYVFSTQDFSATLLRTKGKVPSPRCTHGAALTGTTLLICGGTNFGDENVLKHNSLYLLNLVSREWTRVVVNGPGPNNRNSHTTTVVGSKLFVFGGADISGKVFNDMWTLDLNCLKSQPRWKSYESPTWNKKPLPRRGHVSVTTEGRIIIFGGSEYQYYYNDTWSFDISTRKWTELECTGSVPPPCSGHAAVVVDDAMFVFGGFTGTTYLGDLYALQLSTQRWFKFHNAGSSPHSRSVHAMASDGTRIFVLGGYSLDARADEMSLIHVFDSKDIKFPKLKPIVVNPNEKITQLAQMSSTNPSTLEGDVSEGSTEYHATFAVPHSPSEREVASLEYEHFTQAKRQLSVSLTAQTERDRRIVQLTDELALKSALLEEIKANAAEGERRARLELREHEDRLLAQTSLVKQRDAELVGIRSKLREHEDQLLAQTSLAKQRDAELADLQSKHMNTEAKLDESLRSNDQQIRRYRAELANVRAELEAKKSELEAVRKAKAGAWHTTVTAASLVDLNEDRSMYGLKEDDLESLQCNE